MRHWGEWGKQILVEASESMSSVSPEKLILLRLFTVQRRIRFVNGLRGALVWFAAGSGLASLGLVVLWNWDRLPGPWQWLANAGRPYEFLWLPLLLAIGGFCSRWLILPAPRASAHRLDLMRKTDESLLTAVDWILSEKPRTVVSQRLIERCALSLKDEQTLRRELRRLDRVSKFQYGLLLLFLVPLGVLIWLPVHLGLPDSAAVWLGPGQLQRLTEELNEEIDQALIAKDPEKELKKILKALANSKQSETTANEEQKTLRELQQVVEHLKRSAKEQGSTRELLETLAQRARQGQSLQKEDQKAFDTLQKALADPEQREALKKAAKDWQEGANEDAAQALEALQQEAGDAAKAFQEMAAAGESEAMKSPAQGLGQEFDDKEGDQHSEEGRPGEGKDGQAQQGQGQGQQGQGQPGFQQGQQPADYGKGSTEEDQGASQGASGKQSRRQANRTSDKLEEFKNLHPPERSDIESSQTRVKGQMGAGQRFRTGKEGLGATTEPAGVDGSSGVLEYQESAENALLREEIPADYREEVRLYFEALDK